MIRSLIIILLALIIISCATSGRIIENNDSNNDIQGIKLTQSLIARSADGAIQASSDRSYSVSMIYILEQKKNERPTLFLEMSVKRTLASDKLDSVMFISLENEKINIEASEYRKSLKSNSGSNPVRTRRFLVPENLWIPIFYSDEIKYRFYMGQKEIEAELNRKETLKLKEYFSRAIQLRDANLPPIPEGQKKW